MKALRNDEARGQAGFGTAGVGRMDGPDFATDAAERKSTDTALAEAALAGLNVHRLASGKLLVVQGLAVEHDADSLRRLVRAIRGFA